MGRGGAAACHCRSEALRGKRGESSNAKQCVLTSTRRSLSQRLTLRGLSACNKPSEAKTGKRVRTKAENRVPEANDDDGWY